MTTINVGGDTWNTQLVTANETLPTYSISNTVAYSNGVSYVQNLTSKSSGKWYSEIIVTYTTDDDSYRIGVVGAASPVAQTFNSNFVGEDVYSLEYAAKGDITINDYIGNGEPYNSGDTICIASDFDNNLNWFRRNNGPWFDLENITNSVADPYRLISGSDISIMIGQQKYIGVMLSNGSSATIGQLQFVPPVGFTPWLNPVPYNISLGGILPLPTAQGIIIDTDPYTLSTGNGMLGNNGASGSVTLPSPFVNNAENGVDSNGNPLPSIWAFDPYDIEFPYNHCGAQARVNMFEMPIVIHLVLTQSCVGNPVLMNYPINRTDFRLVRGVPNVIQFFVRDVDRHIPNTTLGNSVLTINIVDTNNQVTLMQRELFTINSATCLFGLSTQPNDLLYWPTGYLQYSILVTYNNGTSSLLWTDRNYSPYGWLTLTDGPLPGPAQPVTLDPTTFLSDLGYNYSTPVAGAAQKGYPDSVQTFTFYTNNYTGNVVIQGSLVNQPSTELQDWFVVTTADFNMTNGATSVNIEGNYAWMRVAVPNQAHLLYPGNPMYSNGVITSITYLN